MGLLESIKSRLTPKKVTVHEKSGKSHEQIYYTNPNQKQPQAKQPSSEEAKQPRAPKVGEQSTITAPKTTETQQKPKRAPTQEQKQAPPKQPQSPQQQQQAQSPADAGARKYGFVNYQDFTNAMNLACGMGSYRDYLNSDMGKLAIHVLKHKKDQVDLWSKGEKTEPGIGITLSRLWYMSQMFHDFDGHTLISDRMFPGLPTIEIDTPKVNPLPEGIVKNIKESKQRLVDKADTEGKQIYEGGHKIGDTTVINGITYRLEGPLNKPRWHRITPKEESNVNEKLSADESNKGVSTASGKASARDTFRESVDSVRERQKEIEAERQSQKEKELDARSLEKPVGLAQDKRQKIAESIIRQSIQAPPPIVNLDKSVEESNLLDHQKEFVLKAHSAFERGEKAFLCGDIMGLGKTYQALALIAQVKPKRCIYVVPKKKLIDQSIGTENNKFKDGDLYKSGLAQHVQITRADNTWQDFSGDGVFITTYASLMANPSLQDSADLIIWDECHNLKGTGTVSQIGNDMNNRSNADGGKVLFMSATPYQKLEEARYLHSLGMFPEDVRGFNNFCRDHGVRVKRSGVGSKARFTYTHERDHEFKLLGLHEKMFKKGIYDHRELKLDGLHNDFPRVQLTNDQLNLFNAVMSELDRISRRARTPSKIRTAKAQRQAIAMRMLESFMIPHSVALAEKEIKAGRQVAVFAQSVSDLKLKEKLAKSGVDPKTIAKISDLPSPVNEVYRQLSAKGYKIVRYYGKHKEDIEEYQKGKADVAICSYSMGGTGISLHHNKDAAKPRTQINMSIPYSGNTFAQVSARSHRLDSKSETNQFFLLPDGVKEAKRFAKICSAKLKSMGASIRGQELGDVGADELLRFERGDLE